MGSELFTSYEAGFFSVFPLTHKTNLGASSLQIEDLLDLIILYPTALEMLFFEPIFTSHSNHRFGSTLSVSEIVLKLFN